MTGALAVAGAVFGALASALAVTIWLAPRGDLHFGTDVLLFAALVGGALGAVLGPAAAWLLLRRVPVGRAVLGTTAGAFAGGLVSAALQIHAVLGAVVGFTAAALILRGRAGAPPRRRPGARGRRGA